jgi:hypothetical protein
MSEPIDFSKIPVFSESYWKRPDSKNKGDENAHKIYEDVGFALTCWELMEEELATLYLALVGATKASNDPVRRAFGSIESNSGRRKAIDAAAEAYFGQHWDNKIVKRAFSNVTESVGWASKRRDDIAHGIVLGQVIDGVRYGSFLFPPDYNTLRTNLYVDTVGGDPLAHTMTKFRFTAEQIRAFGFKFKELKDAIFSHMALIRKDGETIVFVRAVTGGNAFG